MYGDSSAKDLCGRLFTIIMITFVIIIVMVIYLDANTIINYGLDSEVKTTDGYNEMYNESFSGRIVNNGGWIGGYVLIQDHNGTQRTFRKGHITKV